MLLALPLGALAKNFTGNDLISIFSASCQSHGGFTKSAVSDARLLVTVLDSIKNDPNCVSLSGAISQLSTLERKIYKLEGRDPIDIEISKLEAQENELLFQLSRTSDLEDRKIINSILRFIQIDKVGLEVEVPYLSRSRSRGDIKDLYSSIVVSSNALLKTISSNYNCLDQRPQILASVISFVSSIFGGSSYLNPSLGIGISTGTNLLGNIVESFKNSRYEKVIRNISNKAFAQEGYKCVLELLSNRWCGINDAEKLLKLRSKIRELPLMGKDIDDTRDSPQSIIGISDREIPILLKWIKRVEDGVPPRNIGGAFKIKRFYSKETVVKGARALGHGVINQYGSSFREQSTNESRYVVLKSVILNLIGGACNVGGLEVGKSGNSNNIMNEIYNFKYSPYYLLGLESIPRISGQAIDFCEFDPFGYRWPNNQVYVPSISKVEFNYNFWVKRSEEKLNLERVGVLQPDPLQLLISSYDRTDNKLKYSVIDSIKNIKNFLIKNTPKGLEGNAFTTIYKSIIIDFQKIEDIIIGSVIEGIYKDPKEALQKIWKIIESQNGVIALEVRLNMIVRASITEYLGKLEGRNTNLAVQLLVADSFVDVLKTISGKDNFALILADIQRAKPIALVNMEGFIDVFSQSINSILLKSREKILLIKDRSIKSIYIRSHSEICILLSTMPFWPESIKKDLCVGTHLGSVMRGGPFIPKITLDYLNQDFNKRSCLYRDYIRKSKIYQDWGVSL